MLVSLQGSCRYNYLLLGTVLFSSVMDVSLQGVAVVIGNHSVLTYDGGVGACQLIGVVLARGVRAKWLMFKVIPVSPQACSY